MTEEEKAAAGARLLALLEETASRIISLIESLVDRRIRERVRIVNGHRLEVEEPSGQGTIGYRTVRRNLQQEIIELLRRYRQGGKSPK